MPASRSPAGGGRSTGARARSAGVMRLPSWSPRKTSTRNGFEALREPLRDTATSEALQGIVEFDLGELADLDPPRGFGRD